MSVERRLNSGAGFPPAIGKKDPAPAVFGRQTSMVSPIVTMSYNELGHRADDSGWGHVTLVTPYGDQVDVIVPSVDAWLARSACTESSLLLLTLLAS